MYAAAPRAQFLPEPGTPGAEGLGDLAILRNDKMRLRLLILEQDINILQHYKYSIEVEECLQRNVVESHERKQVKVKTS